MSQTGRETLRGGGEAEGAVTAASVHRRWGGNLGYGWNRSTWRAIRNETDAFCKVDESNWDVSFEHVLDALERSEARGGRRGGSRGAHVRPAVRRVQHTGSCGSHMRKSAACAPTVRPFAPAVVKRANGTADATTQWTLEGPSEAGQEQGAGAGGRGRTQNGGWGDHRDREMCGGLAKMRCVAGAGLDAVLAALPL